jgi:hypothetical protein
MFILGTLFMRSKRMLSILRETFVGVLAKRVESAYGKQFFNVIVNHVKFTPDRTTLLDGRTERSGAFSWDQQKGCGSRGEAASCGRGGATSPTGRGGGSRTSGGRAVSGNPRTMLHRNPYRYVEIQEPAQRRKSSSCVAKERFFLERCLINRPNFKCSFTEANAMPVLRDGRMGRETRARLAAVLSKQHQIQLNTVYAVFLAS